MSDAEPAAKKQRADVLRENAFKPGQSGNPKGREKGSRNKLADEFITDVLEAWQRDGKDCLTKMIAEKPGDFVKVAAGILPKELNVKVNELDDLTDEQLARQYAAIAKSLVEAGLSLGAGNEAPGGPEQAGGLPSVH